jgi:hypothetical protein
MSRRNRRGQWRVVLAASTAVLVLPAAFNSLDAWRAVQAAIVHERPKAEHHVVWFAVPCFCGTSPDVDWGGPAANPQILVAGPMCAADAPRVLSAGDFQP